MTKEPVEKRAPLFFVSNDQAAVFFRGLYCGLFLLGRLLLFEAALALEVDLHQVPELCRDADG